MPARLLDLRRRVPDRQTCERITLFLCRRLRTAGVPDDRCRGASSIPGNAQRTEGIREGKSVSPDFDVAAKLDQLIKCHATDLKLDVSYRGSLLPLPGHECCA